ncbi:MAG: metalloregulator ArsR/SmtB family transcription factor [Pseudomonadota bacterium]
MVERAQSDALSDVFKAVSDPTRRTILTLLAQNGPMRVTDIHRQFDLSLNSVSKHIKVLERAGLVARRTDWREHLIELNMAPLSEVDDWFATLRSIWEIRLDALETLVTQGPKDKGASDHD